MADMGIRHGAATVTTLMLTGLALIVTGFILVGTHPNLAVLLWVAGGLVTILGHKVESEIFPNRRWRR